MHGDQGCVAQGPGLSRLRPGWIWEQNAVASESAGWV